MVDGFFRISAISFWGHAALGVGTDFAVLVFVINYPLFNWVEL